jgi:hypothetical protein
VNNIIDSQFLEPGYENFGAFLPFLTFSLMPPEQQNKRIFFEYSYYAIKALELLASHLGIGNITNLGFDKDALCSYIIKNVVETTTSLFFDPRYSNDLEIILQNTYYMIYILKALNRYKLPSWKIKNFVEQGVSYANIKNLYYSYKISAILNLSVEFDIELTQNLVQQLYSKSFKEFYLTPDKQVLDQEIFSWVCEMAKKDRIRIDAKYSPSIPLECSNILSVSLGNLILSNFGAYIVVKFESDQLGVILLDRINENLYRKSIFVPASSRNYPTIRGSVKVYDADKKAAEKILSFNTSYEVTCNNQSIVKTANAVKINFNVSLITGAGTRSLGGVALLTAEVYKDSVYLESIAFSRQDFSKFTSFTTEYNDDDEGNYLFKVYLNDGIRAVPYFIKALTSSNNNYMVLEYLKSIELGKTNVLNATLYNIVSGPDTTVKFESAQLGSITFNKIKDDVYRTELNIPIVPQCYPFVQGNVTVYDNNNKILESFLSFNTNYGLIHNSSFVNGSTNVAFKVSGSILAGGKANPLSFARARVEVYKNSMFVEMKYLIRNDFENSSEFTLDYNVTSAGNYSFRGFLEDGFASEPVFLFDKSYMYSPVPSDNESPDENPSDNKEDDSDKTDQDESDKAIRIVVITAGVTSSTIAIPSVLYFVQKSKAKKEWKKSDMGSNKSKNLNAVEPEKKEKVTTDSKENEDDLTALFLEN